LKKFEFFFLSVLSSLLTVPFSAVSLFETREALTMYLFSLGNQVVTFATLFAEFQAFWPRFVAYRMQVLQRVSPWPTQAGAVATMRSACLDILTSRRFLGEFTIVRRAVGATVNVPRTNVELAADKPDQYVPVVRADLGGVLSDGDAKRLLVAVTWPALLKGWGVLAALNMNTAPLGNLTDRHLGVLDALARSDFRGQLKSALDDSFKDDKKTVSYVIKHLVALGLIFKVNITVEGKSSVSSILWLPVFAPLGDVALALPRDHHVAENNEQLKVRIMQQLALMPNQLMQNRDVVNILCSGRKERCQALRDELVRGGYIELVTALYDDAKVGCWRMLKPFVPPRNKDKLGVVGLTNFVTASTAGDDGHQSNNSGNNYNHDDDNDDNDNDDDDGDNDNDDQLRGDGDDGDGDDGDGQVSVRAAPMDAELAAIAHPVYQEMTLDDQILHCIRKSDKRGMSSRDLCTCLGLNEPADMKRMMKTLNMLAKQYGLKQETVFKGKVRNARFFWVSSDAEAVAEAQDAVQLAQQARAGSERTKRAIARRAAQIKSLLANNRAMLQAELLKQMRVVEENATLDPWTVDRALNFLWDNDEAYSDASKRSLLVESAKSPVVLLLGPGVSHDDEQVLALRKQLKKQLPPKSGGRGVVDWGELTDYGPVERLANVLARQRELEALDPQLTFAAAALAPQHAISSAHGGGGGADGDGGPVGLMVRVRLLHYAMCELMSGVHGGDSVLVRRESVIELLPLRQLARMYTMKTREVPTVLKEMTTRRGSALRLCDLSPDARQQVEQVFAMDENKSAWNKSVRAMLRLNLVEEDKAKKWTDAVRVRRRVLCRFSDAQTAPLKRASLPAARKSKKKATDQQRKRAEARNDDGDFVSPDESESSSLLSDADEHGDTSHDDLRNDDDDDEDDAENDNDNGAAARGEEEVRFDLDSELKRDLAFRRFWLRFEFDSRVVGIKAAAILVKGRGSLALKAIHHWSDPVRAQDAAVLLQKYAAIHQADASRVITMIRRGKVSEFDAWVQTTHLSEKDALKLADAFVHGWLRTQAATAAPTAAAVALRREAFSRSVAGRHSALSKRTHEVFLHMPKASQRRALRRAYNIAKGRNLDHIDDDTEESDDDDSSGAFGEGDDAISDADNTDDDDDDNNNNGDRVKRAHRRGGARSDDDDDDVDDDEGPKGRGGKRARGAAGASLSGKTANGDVRIHSTASLLSFATVLAERFVKRLRPYAIGRGPRDAADSALSPLVAAPLKEADIADSDGWRAMATGVFKMPAAQCREQFKKLMGSEWFAAQLYSQIRRYAHRQNMMLQAPYAWLNHYGSALAPAVVVPRSIDDLRANYEVRDPFTGAALHPFAAVTASFEPANAAALYVADCVLAHMAGVDDGVTAPVMQVGGALREAALHYLRERLFLARTTTRKKDAPLLTDRTVDSDRLANHVRARFERHLADVYSWTESQLGSSAEPLLPLTLSGALELRRRIGATPASLAFGAAESAGATLAMLEMWLHGDVSAHAACVSLTGAKPESSAGAATWSVTLREQKHSDAQRALLPHVAAHRDEPAADYASAVAALRSCDAARRAVAAARCAGERGLTGLELEAALLSDGVDPSQFLLHSDAFVKLGDRLYSHGTLVAALIAADDEAPLRRMIETRGTACFRYVCRDGVAPAATLMSAAPLPYDSCAARIARRAVLGHFERSPGVRPETLVERLFERNASFPSLMSRVALYDQLHSLALHRVLIGSSYSERVWPSGVVCERLIVSKSAHIRFYPPSPVLRLTASPLAPAEMAVDD
jgi:hypothetical protein